MNIVQLHDKVLSFIDQARSGRIYPGMIDAALNSAHVSMLNQKIGAESVTGPVFYYPEETNRIKDQLKYYYNSVIIDAVSIEGSLKINLPIKLKALNKAEPFLFLDVEANIGTKLTPRWINPTPVSTKDEQTVKDNTFLAPKSANWTTSYFTYSGGSLEFMVDPASAIVQVRVGYLKFPSTFSFGTMVKSADCQISETMVIASSPKIVYNDLIKFRGEEFELGSATLFTTGEIYYGYSVVDVDPQLLDLLTSVAAGMISNLRMGILNNQKEN